MAAIDLRPLLGSDPRGGSGPDILLVCYFDPNGISTVYEHVRLWQTLSRLDIEVFNFWPARVFELPRGLDLDRYAGVILHPTVGFFPESLEGIDRRLAKGLARYAGVKVLAKQDEHFMSGAYPRFIAERGFDVLITCVPPDELETVYPRAVTGDIEVVHALTGYVSDFMTRLDHGRVPGRRRPVDLRYRGSLQPLSFGRLGYEKRQIGTAVQAAVAGRGLALDISSRWEDRVFGAAWFDFLAASNAVLGVESGSNLFDFDGAVAQWCGGYAARHAADDPWSDDYYLRAHEEKLHAFEGNVRYAQISPRHFEAAATRTVQVMYEGGYSGIFHPHRHFFPLKRDLSNLDEALALLADEDACKAMTDRVFDEIVLNPAYQYAAFVEACDQAILTALDKKGAAPAPRPPPARTGRPRALYLMSHDPAIDPRVDWLGSSLAERFDLAEIGMIREGEAIEGPRLERLSPTHVRLRLDPKNHDWDWLPNPRRAEGLPPGLQELAMLQLYSQMDARTLERRVGAIAPEEQDLFRFRWHLNHFAEVNGALYQAGLACGPAELVVATDLDTLPAAIALGHANQAPVVYDAHEYWPFSRLDFKAWESEFWAGLERNLARQAAVRVTVAEPLAEHMGQEYGAPFLCVPNAARLQPAPARRAGLGGPGQVVFLFQGNFAPGRGLEALLQAWTRVGPLAHLALRGPDSPHKQVVQALAGALGLGEDQVSFPAAVAEDALVEAAGEADVGLIPYDPAAITYRLCCPNKLSEYMAAGLPLLVNRLEYVEAVVGAAGAGRAVDFNDAAALAAEIDALAAYGQARARLGAAGRRYFEAVFHWEAVSRPLFERIEALVPAAPQTVQPIALGWTADPRFLRTRAAEGLKIKPVNYDLAPAEAVTSAVLGPDAVDVNDYWRDHGAGLAPVADGARITLPSEAWHYGASVNLPMSADDGWLGLTTESAEGSVLCGLYDTSLDTIDQEQAIAPGPGRNRAHFRLPPNRQMLLLFRTGQAGSGAVTFVKAEIRTVPPAGG